jgi:uncharacterized protein (DUF1501 family)
MNRRDFLKQMFSLSLSIRWSSLMRSQPLWASAPSKKKIVLIDLNGGWDILETVDPKGHSTAQLDLSYPWANTHPLNGHPEARLGRWCPNLAQKGVSLIRGLSFGTTSHDAGRAYSDTGVLSNDGRTNAASLSAILGSESEALVPLLQLPGGPTPQSDRGLLKPLSVVRAENLEQYRSLLPSNDKAQYLIEKTMTQLSERLEKLPLDAKETNRIRTIKDALEKGQTHVKSNLRDLLQLSSSDQRPYHESLRRRFQEAEISVANQHLRFADGLALAKKLIENNVTDCLALGLGGFDTHYQQDKRLKPLLLAFDTCLSLFLEQLNSSNHLNDTLVVVQSDFGRTPRINSSQGRDHWVIGGALLAGGGLPKGLVIGGTDENLNALNVNLKTGEIDPNGTQLNPSHILGTVVGAVLGDEYLQRRPYLSKIDAISLTS